jgi:hypothetical protein
MQIFIEKGIFSGSKGIIILSPDDKLDTRKPIVLNKKARFEMFY